MATQSEAALEKALLDKLVDGGYEQINVHDENGLKINLKSQIEKFNKIELTDVEFNRILTFLEGGTIFDKAKKLRDRYELHRPEGTVYIQFLNKKDWCKNLFQVSNQIRMKKTYKNRYDVTILINGFPLVQIELKKRGIELKRAFNQIERYQKHSYRGLFQYIQIFVISNGVNTKYYANNKSLSFKYTFFWKDKDNHNVSNLEEFAEVFLEKCHLSKMITKYIVLNETDQALMVLRAYQYYAVEAIMNVALNTTQNGYVWHTTGSGKTLTSFKVSQLLAEEENIDKIIFVVDRKDLDYQTTSEFNKFSEESVDGTDFTHILVKQLLGPNKLIITTIQKLTRAVDRHSKRIEGVKDKKVILMFDECHRSQFGTMHQKITSYFTNLQYFGFTGTPIFEVNAQCSRTTKDLFGRRLHSYLIQHAIRDENVLGFSVEYLGKYRNKTTLDIEVEAIDTRELMESEKRLEKIANYIIANHDRKTYKREFNGIFAVSSVEMLTKYYEIFKKKQHNLKIAAIFTYDVNEEMKSDEHSRDKLERYMKDYNEMFGTNFTTETFDLYYVDIAKRMKDKQIDLLLVVNIFLTGFDSKFLNTLYLDKNLQYHGLVQAYSRTNRVVNEKKSFGNIVCFRNLKKSTDDAIRLYSDENPSETVLIGSYQEYVDRFNKILDEEFRKITTVVSDIDDLPDEVELIKFVQIFRELLRILNKLNVFTEFSFDDLGISEQTFEDYKSKYLDIYESVRNKPAEKVSILDDVDFEVELIRRDDINVAYILALLKELDHQSDSFEKDREFILQTMRKTRELRSKIDLIEKFIDHNIPQIDNRNKIEENFEIYIDQEKNKAIKELFEEEKLKPDITEELIAEYEFSGKMRNDVIKNSFQEKMGLKERRSKLKQIKDKIMALVDKFTW